MSRNSTGLVCLLLNLFQCGERRNEWPPPQCRAVSWVQNKQTLHCIKQISVTSLNHFRLDDRYYLEIPSQLKIVAFKLCSNLFFSQFRRWIQQLLTTRIQISLSNISVTLNSKMLVTNLHSCTVHVDNISYLLSN